MKKVRIFDKKVTKIRASEIRVREIRVSKIRVREIRVSEIRVSKIRVSEIRISSNHRELHGAIFQQCPTKVQSQTTCTGALLVIFLNTHVSASHV